MDDVYIGAGIVIITLIVEETLRFFYSVRVEREKTKLKKQEDGRNFRLNSINEMKNKLIDIRFDLAKFYNAFSNPNIRGAGLTNAVIKLYILKSSLHTFSETKDLAIAMDELGEELQNYERIALSEKDSNKLAELNKKMIDKIEKLLKTSL